MQWSINCLIEFAVGLDRRQNKVKWPSKWGKFKVKQRQKQEKGVARELTFIVPHSGVHVERGNIERLATAHTFQKMLNKLKETEKHYRDIGSHGVTEALELEDKHPIRHNFYADKCER